MAKKYKPENLKNEVLGLGFDLRAETFGAYLQDEIPLSFAFTDFFKRRFSHDITDIGTLEKSYKKIEVNLSRRGFYNIFPERFFHSTYSSTPFVETMVQDYKNRKIEETHARKFFKPLEEEFFIQKIASEQEESAIFKSLGSPDLVSFLTNLWNMDPKFPKKMATKILKTIPFMHKIAGDLPLLTRILESIIQEDIKVDKDYATVSGTALSEGEPLMLGVNLATSGNGKTYLPKYTFTLHEINEPEKIENYLPNGSIASVVDFFLEHTLPFESDFEVNFTLKKNKREFVMSETPYAGRLGISSII